MAFDGKFPFDTKNKKGRKNMKLAVIFGGMSTEHDVSVVSGTSVIKRLNKGKYEILPIYIDKKRNMV